MFQSDVLNDFMSLGRPVWVEVRRILQQVLSKDEVSAPAAELTCHSSQHLTSCIFILPLSLSLSLSVLVAGIEGQCGIETKVSCCDL